ncbi:twin-arginine translocation signal domain-containing protein [Serinicoccus sp. CUA-874]|uniref:twin-arginine translocation signal domain-containing protein n=1 Tax=Serinicoccus sp. CUA-874 TaxID=1517939 RepID=UPI00117A7DD9|nr:twin-arginine translocation signal domain-containing protein [Serinicoccus sp. CUA-874]
MRRFDDLPEADTGRLRDRLRERPSRRGFIARVLGAGTAVGVGSLALVNRGAPG